MEIYDTEEQQVEAIKDWWKNNGKSVIGGAIIGFGLIFGWRAYNDNMLESQAATSAEYEQLLIKVGADASVAPTLLQTFIDSNENTQYAALASLKLAQILVEQEKYELAEAQLNWTVANGSELVVAAAQYRLARLQTQMQKYDAALASLALISAEAYKAKVAETKGDIYLAQGDSEAAKTAFEEAVASGGNSVSGHLQMKLNDLAKAEVVLEATQASAELK